LILYKVPIVFVTVVEPVASGIVAKLVMFSLGRCAERGVDCADQPMPIHRSHGGDLPRGGSDGHGRRRTRAESSVVMTPGGTGTGAGLYTYVASPTVTSVAPTSGPTRGYHYRRPFRRSHGGDLTGMAVVNATTV
jgi:hypothetical protein